MDDNRGIHPAALRIERIVIVVLGRYRLIKFRLTITVDDTPDDESSVRDDAGEYTDRSTPMGGGTTLSEPCPG